MRLFDPKRQILQAGDEIQFSLVGGDESVTALVVGLHYFPSFAALYEAMIPRVGAVGLGYGEGEVPPPADMLDYYASEAVVRYGVVGIEIQLKS
jgi:ASC-1-like (ASCH) protein